MSRCFPFPPPGYEKKPRDEHDLLTKASVFILLMDDIKDKHKEKKDRKEKHKDRKKDKDREKDKSRSSDEKRAGQTDVVSRAEKNGNSNNAKDTKESKFTEELAKRIRDGDQGVGSQMVGNSMVDVQQKMEGTCTTMDMVTWKSVEGKDKRKEENDEKTAADKHGDKNGEKFIEMVQNLVGAEQKRIQGLGRPMENDANKVERNETIIREADDKKGARHKDRDREEKKSKGKDKEKDKAKEKEKAKEKGESKQKEHYRFGEIDKKETLDISTNKPPLTVKDIGKGDGNVTNLKKRNGFVANGFLHENDKRPTKQPKQEFSSTHLSLENGKTLEPYHIAIQSASNREGASHAEKQYHKTNGTIDGYSSQHNSTPLVSTMEGIENGEASTRLPHPDSKYLSEICTVTKMEEWPETDDQDWLFGGGRLELKPKAEPDPDKTPQVWSKALHIESGDVWALPYVIPY
ncbi:hypothetical protein QJS10_CPB22g00716 [Acorus calamus]|uniref:Myb-like protein X n=1 Tax=Acorus calamus TaxID=4465 RepID=A0AAV9C0G9_ACOCL|nr:hypothetical protein QJS10_CPB22g00716 [Acorus calamus]